MDQAKEAGDQIITILEVLVVQVPINLNMVAMVDMARVVVDPVLVMDKINQLLVIQIIGVNNNKMVGQHSNNNGQIKVKQLL